MKRAVSGWPITALALGLILAYQRFVSPYKGFACAYRVHTGHCSCSVLGYRAIRRFGVKRGLGVLRERTFLCGVAQRRYAGAARRAGPAQRGDCDCGACPTPDCDCDLPGGKSALRWCGLLDCADVWDCGSDDDKRRRKEGRRKTRREQKAEGHESRVHLPRRGRTRLHM